MAVDKLVDSAQLDGYFTNIASAIRSKAGVSSTYTPSEMPQAIQDIPSGGAEPKVVHFIDYDGTVLYSYTATEAQALQALPPNPSHERLVAQGWNYTLSEVKAEAESVGGCTVGQMYKTVSGATEIDIYIEGGSISPYLRFYRNANVNASVDWGDGSPVEQFTGAAGAYVNVQHSYASGGAYTIKIAANGKISFVGSSSSSTYSQVLWTNGTGQQNRGMQSLIRAVYLGDNIVNMSDYAFAYCTNLKKISINNVATIGGDHAFYYAYSLSSITFPPSTTSFSGSNHFAWCVSLRSVSINNKITSFPSSTFSNCYALSSISVPSSVKVFQGSNFYNCMALENITIPSATTSISTSVFNACGSLQKITIPSGVTKLENNLFYQCPSLREVNIEGAVTSIGTNAFSGCYSLESITIPNTVTSIGNNAFVACYNIRSVEIPNTVTSIGTGVFQNCYSLESVVFPNTATSIPGSIFQNCYNLASISISDNVTSIGQNAFYGCNSLKSVEIGSGVTSISSNAFYNCYGLTTITIPSGVTSMGAGIFQNCYLLNDIHIEATTPPTLGTSAFSNINSSYTIYVPSGTLSAYQSATNWSTYSSHIVEETA